MTRRIQPLLPASSVTGYGAQGLTLDGAIIDLAFPPREAGGRAVRGPYAYVALSRVRMLKDACIVRFDLRTLTQRPAREVLTLQHHLNTIEDATRVEMDMPRRPHPHPPLDPSRYAAFITPENKEQGVH